MKTHIDFSTGKATLNAIILPIRQRKKEKKRKEKSS